uniref:Uncharacterized protein n=1 Tax=Arundo donax TaxID=35708 RepID=A0A0A9B7K7_ARUDO
MTIYIFKILISVLLGKEMVKGKYRSPC